MGCCQSRMELEETLSRCKARRRYMKQLVKGRQAFAIAHFLYLRSLRSTGAALLQFANAETPVRHHLPPMAPSPPPTPPRPQRSKAPPSPPPPPPPPQMSPCSDNWTSATASPLLHPLPPPPPPPPPSSSWDFWDPFLPSSRSVAEEWEDATTTTITTTATATATTTMASEAVAASAAPPPSSVVGGFSISEDSASELAMVVSRNKKSLSEIVKELDDYFLKAADAGNRVSAFLEAPNCGFSSDQGLTGRICSYGRSLSPLRWPWGWSSKANQYGGFERLGEASMAKRDAAALFGGDFMSHRSTVEKLYAWEKKLYLEVKNAERLKEEHEKKVGLLRRQEARGADYLKVEKTRKEIERLESRLTVASQAMETTSLEIVRVREVELFPQLVELLNRLRAMWRSMYECHQVQTHIVQQLEYLNDGGGGGGADPTSELHRQSTLQLELEVQRWHSSFCELIESQRDYIHSLAGWLRLSLFGGAAGKPRHHHHHITAEIYSLLEEWQLALDRVPDKVASEGIKSFLTVVHAVVLQQDEEHRQRRRSEAAGRALEKAAAELMRSSPAPAREGKVAAARARAEEEKSKWEKSAGITRAMTLNSLQTGFPNVFQAMTGFSGVCTQAFESVYGHRRSPRELKMLLP